MDKLRQQSNDNSQFESEVQRERLLTAKIARSKILLHRWHQTEPDHPQIASGGPGRCTVKRFWFFFLKCMYG